MLHSFCVSIIVLLSLALAGALGRHLVSRGSAALFWLAGMSLGLQSISVTPPAQAQAGCYYGDFKLPLDGERNITATDNSHCELWINHLAGFSGTAILAHQVRDLDASSDKPINPRVPVFRRKKEITVTSPMLDSITQNTPGYSEGYAAGVPKRFAWCRGSYKPAGYSAPPSDFTAVTGWGAIYPKAGAPAYSNPDATIEIANARTYVRLKATREWVLIQDQPRLQIIGSHFVADFSPQPNMEMRSNTQPDGSVAVGAPAIGYNNHFWFSERGTFPAGSVDGVYVQMDMRTNDPNVSLVANVGADWWRDTGADFLRNFSNNPGAGMSNWVELTTEWSTLRFYSLSTSELQASPPPPLVEPTQARPAFTRRLLSFSPHCASKSRRIP
ncbi:hypothetical protein DFP91_2690 [Pseudorhodoplanes sinuspersici]|nr:hypothetical protein DFP91_2690 [Pseudorhodoplanes sinuspersici]